jgi:hypothetical protein
MSEGIESKTGDTQSMARMNGGCGCESMGIIRCKEHMSSSHLIEKLKSAEKQWIESG